MIIAATGHRPHKLGSYSDPVHARLAAFAFRMVVAKRPSKVISGMALGWDQHVATAALQLGIPLVAAVPFIGQERPWTQRERDHWTRLVNRAAEVVFVTDPAPDCENAKAVAKALQKRNEWMVDRADEMLALWDGTAGGTANCVTYARLEGVPVDNVWRTWTLPEDLKALI